MAYIGDTMPNASGENLLTRETYTNARQTGVAVRWWDILLDSSPLPAISNLNLTYDHSRKLLHGRSK